MSRVLMVASEAAPFCKTGGLADVLGALPPALKHRGDDVAVVLPAYRANHYPTLPYEVWRNLWIPLGSSFLVDIYQTVERDVPFYFVHCPPLFDRDGIYAQNGWDYSDNYMRYAVLSAAATGVVRHLFRPDVIHCHDWQSALTGLYIRHNLGNDPTFFGIQILFTIHNLGYQGEFGREILPQIGVDQALFNPEVLEFHGKVNYLKAGIHFSDGVSTVSKGYAREIQTPEYGFGLDGFLRAHNRLTGILNGADYMEWDPRTDPHIAQNYWIDDLSGKRECKRALLDEFGFPESAMKRPLIGIASRFASQKGFDLIGVIAHALLDEDLSLVVLGSGERQYEQMFEHLASTRPDKVRVWIGYNNALAHRIEAGSDMFLMPSRYEPSGLNQMYSLRYGTVPIVRATGGLDDTIEDGITGFKFSEYAGLALFTAIQKALQAYGKPQRWTAMMVRGMQKDFSWNAAAGEYSALYRNLLAR